MAETSHNRFAFNQKLIDWSEKFSFKNKLAKKLFSAAVFLIAMHCFYSYIGIYRFINSRPCSIHISAQTSRACIALNYYENNMNFFTPQYQRNMAGPGYTGLEFPIVYYLGAILYKLFGFNEVYLRVISLIITSIGLLFFFLLSLNYTKSNWLSLFITGAVVCSPAFLFYTPNFMPDPPSIALILISWFWLFKYKDSEKTKHLNLYIVFSTLGVLLKVTGAICFVIVICLLILDRLKFFKTPEKTYLFNSPKKIILRILAGLLLVIAWYKYSTWFPAAHGGMTFLLEPNAYQNWEGLLEVLGWMEKLWLDHYYSTESYILLGVAASFVLLTVFMANRLLISITVLYILGSLCYFLFFLNQFIHHDYYIITMLPTLFFLFLCFADVISKLSERYFFPLRFVVLIALFFNLRESFAKCRKKYYERNGTEIYYWTGDYRAYEDLEPKLRAKGIAREDRFICGFDNSDCASLYLMNQLGATFGVESTVHDVDSLIRHPNTKYLVLTDSAGFRKTFNHDFSDKIIITHRGLIVYKLK